MKYAAIVREARAEGAGQSIEYGVWTAAEPAIDIPL